MPIVYNDHPMIHDPIPNPNSIVGHHPHLRLIPPPHMRHQPQPVANQYQLARRPLQPAPNTRARAAVIIQTRQRQQQQQVAAANAKAEQASCTNQISGSRN